MFPSLNLIPNIKANNLFQIYHVNNSTTCSKRMDFRMVPLLNVLIQDLLSIRRFTVKCKCWPQNRWL